MTTKKLLAAAKADMPSSAARANVWAGVSGAIGGAAAVGASGVTAATVLGSGAGAKLLAIGTLFGGTVAVGLATALLHIGPAPTPPVLTNNAPAAAIARPASANQGRPAGVESMATATGSVVPTSGVNSPPVSTSIQAPAPAHAASRHAKPAAHEDSLAREASLVAEARSALGRADPRSALHAIRAARALPSRQLVPEELAVEEQALRALGQTDEANGIDVQLRLQYPEAALAR
jgi:hypothetical protein